MPRQRVGRTRAQRLLVVVSALVLIAGACSANEDSATELNEAASVVQTVTVPPSPDSVADSIVRILGFGCGSPALGSGFAVAEHLIVTSGHLVTGRDPETLGVKRPNGNEYSATLIAFDEHLDLALLQVDGTSFAPVELIQEIPESAGVGIGLRTEVDGQYVNEVDFEVDRVVTVNWDGVFRNTESSFHGVQLNADISRGDSGTALFVNENQVLGLIHSTSRAGLDRGYAVSSIQIAEFLDEEAASGEVVAPRCA